MCWVIGRSRDKRRSRLSLEVLGSYLLPGNANSQVGASLVMKPLSLGAAYRESSSRARDVAVLGPHPRYALLG